MSFDEPNLHESENNLKRIPVGAITPEQLPESMRATRHILANQHDGIRGVHIVAKNAERLAKKALDRLDDLMGVEGQRHIDGGGTIGRLEVRIEEIKGAVRSQGTQNKWIIGLLVIIVLGLLAFAAAVVSGGHL